MSYPQTINGIFFREYDRTPERNVYFTRQKGQWVPVRLLDAALEAEKVALALRRLGVQKGEAVGILSQTRPEWISCDTAILALTGITVGIYPSTLSEQVGYILNHCEARLVFVENLSQLNKVLEARAAMPRLSRVILLEGEANLTDFGLKATSWKELLALGEAEVRAHPGLFRELGCQAQPDDVATLIYTSGTTGHPKGAILTHRNFYEIIQSVSAAFQFRPDEVSLIYLPLAHSLQRFTIYQGIQLGGTGYFAQGLDSLARDMAETGPTVMAVVPRVPEKIYTRIMATVENGSSLKKRLFFQALEVGKAYARIPRGQPVPRRLKLQHAFYERLVFANIRKRLGGRMDRMISGAAPLSPMLSEFFQAIGILLIEGYGLTETTSPATLNTLTDYRFGTVGKALPGVQIKIAEDGEVLLKSPGVFQGYYKDPEATAEALQDGWFYTGDVGTLDEDGYLRITDRKKDLIITAAGKNIAPQDLENQLTSHRLVEHAVLHGDRRKYLSALLTLEEREVRAWLRDRTTPWEQLVHDPRVEAEIDGLIQGYNRSVPSYETIKRYAILSAAFSVESGELTPSLKLRRKVITQKYQALLDSFYQETAVS